MKVLPARHFPAGGSQHPMIGEVVLEAETIRDRVQELAQQIRGDYLEKDLVVVGVLKGAQSFTCDLVRALGFAVTLDFLSISCYLRSPGEPRVRILKELDVTVAGRHVLLVEDIVDTGLTLHHLVEHLLWQGPESLRICTLLDRPELRLVDLPIGYVGFEVSGEFLIGYGLDYQGLFRNLPRISCAATPVKA